MTDQDFYEFFKMKINWKFINFIKYHLTKYEDLGYNTYICAQTTSKSEIFIIRTNDSNYMYYDCYSTYIDFMKDNKIYYYINIFNKNIILSKSKVYLEELKMILDSSHKCETIELNKNIVNTYLLVKPKL